MIRKLAFALELLPEIEAIIKEWALVITEEYGNESATDVIYEAAREARCRIHDRNVEKENEEFKKEMAELAAAKAANIISK